MSFECPRFVVLLSLPQPLQSACAVADARRGVVKGGRPAPRQGEGPRRCPLGLQAPGAGARPKCRSTGAPPHPPTLSRTLETLCCCIVVPAMPQGDSRWLPGTADAPPLSFVLGVRPSRAQFFLKGINDGFFFFRKMSLSNRKAFRNYAQGGGSFAIGAQKDLLPFFVVASAAEGRRKRRKGEYRENK